MQKSSRKNTDKTKEDAISSKKLQDENKKTGTLSTPRNYVQKASANDIYAQKKVQVTRAPKKVGSTAVIKTSPMNSLLKSSSSTASVMSHREKPIEVRSTKKVKEDKPVISNANTAKRLSISNVTVSTPPAKRKLELTRQNTLANLGRKVPDIVQKNKMAGTKAGKSEEVTERQRQKTRTLTDEEVTVLNPEGVDNNREMRNLLKLNAKPKAFFVNLEGEKMQKVQAKPISPAASDVSYEDDFESYESDFESYHSDRTGSNENMPGSEEDSSSDGEPRTGSREDADRASEGMARVGRREGKDEERMLDSGNFDMERRSATRPPMAGIVEITEGLDYDEKKVSLPDEGFQDMSSSSGARSHVDVLERTLFIDFEKSRTKKKKLMISRKTQQRAKDILSMIKLHEMAYSLFEMQPIPYDLYMATFGRQNYMQTSTQTFDDGNTEEVQTDEIELETKWTQHPVKFSNFEHHFNEKIQKKVNDEDFLNKFTFIFDSSESRSKTAKTSDGNYKSNPLRIYLEQRDGVGTDIMMPQDVFETNLQNTAHSTERLKKFLKKTERRISNMLSLNSNHTATDLKKSNFPYSKGYSTLYEKSYTKLLQNHPVTDVVVSKDSNAFIITIHNRKDTKKSLACLWDITTGNRKPLKVLTAIENIVFSLFNGKSDGIVIATLQDNSIHLWDLSESPTIVQNTSQCRHIDDVINEGLTQAENDRDWNLRNNFIPDDAPLPLLQACAFTSSAASLEGGHALDSIVGMDFVDDKLYRLDGGRKIVGQICTLQRIGVLSTWLIVQQKNNAKPDLGNAFWSKTKLEKNYDINLTDYIDPVVSNTPVDFNLTAAKKRLAAKKGAKVSRANTAVKSERPSTAVRTVSLREGWDSGVLCSDVKVLSFGRVDCFLIAKNCGEVLCCRRVAGNVRVQKLLVSNDKSTITLLATSGNGLPYFLAATDSGTTHLCTIEENRVLLTLDCRNIASESHEKCSGDHKGRYIGTVPVKPVDFATSADSGMYNIKSLSWSPSNPCRLITRATTDAAAWDLTRSDIYASKAIRRCEAITYTGDGHVIMVSEGEVQLHQLEEKPSEENVEIFRKYVALL